MFEQFIDPLICRIAFVQKVDYDHIVFLTVTVTASDTLFNTLRIPRQIIVDYQRAELQVDTFSTCFCGNQDFRFFLETVNQSMAQHDSFTARGIYSCIQLIFCHVFGIDFFRFRITLASARETDYIPCVSILLQIVPQIFHGAAGFSKNNSLFFCAEFAHFLPAAFKRNQQIFGLGICSHPIGPIDEAVHQINFCLKFAVVNHFIIRSVRR